MNHEMKNFTIYYIVILPIIICLHNLMEKYHLLDETTLNFCTIPLTIIFVAYHIKHLYYLPIKLISKIIYTLSIIALSIVVSTML